MQVSLALQGGGAYGAFTWGALDRLLVLPGLRIHSISATSSGAMNACALAQGWSAGGAVAALHHVLRDAGKIEMGLTGHANQRRPPRRNAQSASDSAPLRQLLTPPAGNCP